MPRRPQPQPATTPDQRRASIHDVVATSLCVDRDRVTDDATFASLGADSLDVIEISLDLEQAFGRDLASVEIEDLATVGALVAAVEPDFA